MQVDVKIDDFRQISRKWYNIDAQLLLKSNRKSYRLDRMVTLPMTSSDPNYRIFSIFAFHLRNVFRNFKYVQ